ncbi:ABC transporter permease [Verrucomicrobiales bacterium]|nr:ABC transporter permease [Verrucomicrobiales bacterium]MDB4359162.1 ABC transporter permease [Verrucomicrobiales bacterium]
MKVIDIINGASLFRLKRAVILGVKSLWMHKLRSMLTAMGIVFGVCSVIAMLAIGEGASYEAQQQIKDLGSQNVILESVKPTNNTTAGEQERSLILEYGLTYHDILQMQATVPGVEVTVPSREVKDFLWNRTNSVDGVVLGTVSWYPKMKNRDVLRGRFFTELEMASSAPVCVLTQSLARQLFPLDEPVGLTVRMRTSYFRVIGVIEDDPAVAAAAEGMEGTSQSSGEGMEMMVPMSTLKDHFGDVLFKYRSGSFEAVKVELHEVTVRIEDPDQVKPAAQAIQHILERNHKDVDYKMTVPLDLLQRAERTKQIFNIVLGSIAAISLLVGGIGIMNIMLATVTERTREIGIRRALGAKKKDIVTQFLIETVMLSGAGGLLGVALGIAIPVIITHFAGMKTVIEFWAPAMAFSISVMTGVLFGIYPAFRAADMNPVEALRHE